MLFNVPSMPDYGRLSNRSLEEMEAGARVEVAPYKKDADGLRAVEAVEAGRAGWPSPRGSRTPGRPGWHIECSAMAEKHLGRCSTSTAAASTSSSRTTRTRSRSRAARTARR